MTDPLRPPDTDDEPWAVPAPDPSSREWALVCAVMLALMAVVAWKVTR